MEKAVQVIFSQKRIKPTHPPLYFNENQTENQIVIKRTETFWIDFDSGLTFHRHLREKIISTRRGIDVIRFLSSMCRGMSWIKCINCMCDLPLSKETLFITNLIPSLLWNSCENLNLLNTLQHLL